MKTKTVYVCSVCGYASSKWYGQCPACREWNTLEEELRPIIPVPYAISSVPDPKFGEAIVLLVEFTPLEPIRHYIAHHLEAYKRPKRILQVEQIPKTETGKVRRAGCRELALKKS